MSFQRYSDIIRGLYPDPAPSNVPNQFDERSYCVGGAFIRYFQESVDSFPSRDRLAGAIQWANPNIDRDVAFNYAQRIILANDRGQFERAWETVDEALTATEEDWVEPELTTALPVST